MSIQPFPYQHLARLSQAEVSLVRRVRQQLGPQGPQALQRWERLLDPQREAAGARVVPTLVTCYGPDQLATLRRASAGALGLQGPEASRALLALNPRLCGALLGLALQSGPLPLVRAASEAELGLAAFVLALLLNELGSACCWTIAPVAPSWPQRAAVLESAVTLGCCAGTAWLIFPEGALVALPPAQPALSPRSQRLASLPICLPVEAGRLRLSLAELESLAVGDQLIWSSCPRRQSALDCLVRVGEGGLPARASGTQLTICAPFRLGGLGMKTSDSQETTLAEQLPVEVVVELGRLRLSAAEVISLGSGDVLTLDQPVTAAVSLRVGDRLLARGELVDVEGEAGVRLSEVFD